MKVFLPLLCLLFIALKLCHVIAWSWIWVLAPLWMPLTISLLIVLGAILLASLTSLL